MENLDKKQCEGGMCQHGGCCSGMSMCGHGCHGGKHHLVKIILKLIIVIIIFSCGFQLGEISGSIRGAGYGRELGNRGDIRMMQGYNYNYPNVIPNTNNVTIPTPAPKQ